MTANSLAWKEDDGVDEFDNKYRHYVLAYGMEHNESPMLLVIGITWHNLATGIFSKSEVFFIRI